MVIILALIARYYSEIEISVNSCLLCDGPTLQEVAGQRSNDCTLSVCLSTLRRTCPLRTKSSRKVKTNWKISYITCNLRTRLRSIVCFRHKHVEWNSHVFGPLAYLVSFITNETNPYCPSHRAVEVKQCRSHSQEIVTEECTR